MNLHVEFPGQNTRFEGNRIVQIKGLPAGATIRHATVTLTPVSAPGREMFVEELRFNGNQGDFGCTQTPGMGFVEVDFHTRRTLATVQGLNLNGALLQVDLGGGVFVEINQYGAIRSPEDDDTELFRLDTDHILPGLTVTRFSLRQAQPPVTELQMNANQLLVRTTPTNVSLGLGKLPPFWTHTGEMAQPQTSSDFADVMQLFLNEADVENGDYVVPLVIHSDALARLNVSVDIEFVTQVSALPEGVAEASLPFNHDGAAQIESQLLQVSLPVGANVLPGETSVRVLGSFDESRVLLGPTGPVEAATAVSITPQQSQAQPLLFDKTLAATAVDLLLTCISRAAVLNINLLGDVDGKPFGDPLLAKPVALDLDRDAAGTPTWVSVQLPQEFEFQMDKRVWLVIQASEGEAAWSAEIASADNIGLQNSTTGGLAWRLTQDENVNGRLSAFYRLRHTPQQFEMPLEVLVGEGETAVRVGLDRFQPLGRVDFNIDIPEFADAINQVAAAASGAALCPQGEQLQNENFSTWTRSGSVPRESNQLNVSGAANLFSMHMAPQGNKLYLIGANETQFGALDLPCHDFSNLLPILANAEARLAANAVSLQTQRSIHMAVSHDERRAYVGANSILLVLDPINKQPVALKAVNLGFQLSDMALSPDAGRLFMSGAAIEGSGHQLVAVETAVLEQALFSDAESINLSDLKTVDVDLGQPPTALALTPSGDAIFVTLVSEKENQTGLVAVFEIRPDAFVSRGPIVISENPQDIAVTPDGQLALVVDPEVDQISLIDTNRLLNVQNITLPVPLSSKAVQPTAITVAPDGATAYTANAAGASVSVIDLQTRRAVQTVSLPLPAMDITVTPQGDNLYVVVADDYAQQHSLVQIPMGTQKPDNWQLTTGFVTPLCYWDSFKLTAGLGPLTKAEHAVLPNRPSSLSQVVPAAGGCVYDFNFWGIACDLDAVAEVIWLGDGCTLQKTDRVPIAMADISAARVIIRDGQSQKGGCLETLKPDLQLHRARLTAPEGAVQAEIRFIVPPKVNAAVDSVSFQASINAVDNNDLRFVEDGELAGWRLIPETAVGFIPIIAVDHVRLQNSGSAAVAVAQDFAVTAGQPFELTFEGFVAAQLSTLESPRVELHWAAADGTLTGEVSKLAITAVSNEKHTLKGSAPTNAAAAELRLVISPSTTLAVSQIFFQPIEIIQVPINFIAQSPGSMTISDFHVAYDMPGGITRPPTPTAGLCQPTPPGRSPGGKPGDACVCPWCPNVCSECADEAIEAATAAASVKQTGRPIRVEPQRRRALSAQLRPVETANNLVVGSLPPPIQPMETEIAALMPATDAAWITLAGDITTAAIPLTTIKGIGPKRAAALAALNIHTVPQLAAADPALIADMLGFVTEDIAADYAAAAQSLLLDPALRQVPLISCVMPTADRLLFVSKAIEYFLRQDYPNRELIVVDDGKNSAADLIPDDERIHYLRLETPMTIGAKRNLGFEAANGHIFANWDDDVWTDSWRLSYQAAVLLHHNADICGLHDRLHFDMTTGQAWHSVRPPGKRPWMAGSALSFRRDFWSKNPFPDLDLGEDIQFVRSDPAAKIVPLQATTFQVDIIHGTNTSPKNSASPLWYPFPAEEIQALMGNDWEFYSPSLREKQR